MIDSNLDWKHHIDHIGLKISKIIGLIAKLRHLVPIQTLLLIYNSLIHPYLSYGIVVWGQASKTQLLKLLKLQKRALRFIDFKTKTERAISLLNKANVLPIDSGAPALARQRSTIAKQIW